MRILTLDIGTTKLAAGVFDANARAFIARESCANKATLKTAADRHEQCPETIFRSCAELLGRVCASAALGESPRCLAITGQMHGVLLADSRLHALSNLITWCDRRADKLAATLADGSWPEERTGCIPRAGYGGLTLAVMAKSNAIPVQAKAFTIADYVAARFCGTIAIDAGHAASWGICDARNRKWDDAALARLGVPPEILPPIRPDLSASGQTRNNAGLPDGITVRLPLGDNQASFIGACAFARDAILLNLGTGGQISMPVDEYFLLPNMETRPMPFGGFLLVGASLCGGRAYALLAEFFRQTLAAFGNSTPETNELYSMMNSLAAASEHELAVDTRFAGTRQDPHARGCLSNITTASFTPGALARGVTRGMIQELAAMLPQEQRSAFSRIIVGGNVFRKNPLAISFAAEEFNLPCVPAGSPEEAAAGAAIAAARAEGMSC